jgi:hypothetical protein
VKIFFATFGIFPPREYLLKSAGAKRLVSFADPNRVGVLNYYREPLVKPPRRRKK